MQGDSCLGDWLVQPALCRLSKDGKTVQVRVVRVEFSCPPQRTLSFRAIYLQRQEGRTRLVMC